MSALGCATELDELTSLGPGLGRADGFGDCSSDEGVSCDECPDAPGCGAPSIGPEPQGHPARYPIVLLHGFNSTPGTDWAFHDDIAEALRSDGHEVFVATVHPYRPVPYRAAMLRDEVLGLGASKVHLITHSMGGLDARYAITDLGLADHVASLTTIAGPHGGSFLADAVLGRDLDEDQMRSVIDLWAWLEDITYDQDVAPDIRETLETLSSAEPFFGPGYEDDPRVFYQSWAGISSYLGGEYEEEDLAACEHVARLPDSDMDQMRWVFWSLAGIVNGPDDVPHDGFVTVESAKFGNFRGCIPIDHLGELGQPGLERPLPDTGWDAVRFYRFVAYELAELEDCPTSPTCGGEGPWGTICSCPAQQ